MYLRGNDAFVLQVLALQAHRKTKRGPSEEKQAHLDAPLVFTQSKNECGPVLQWNRAATFVGSETQDDPASNSRT
jgi:hypothetical protein